MLILIASKQRSLRNALKGFLQTRPVYEVVGTVASKEALFNEVETTRPDLIILDEDITQLLVDHVILPLQQFDSCPQMIVLGRSSDSTTAYLDAGAAAFVEKADPPKSLLTAIETIRWRINSV